MTPETTVLSVVIRPLAALAQLQRDHSISLRTGEPETIAFIAVDNSKLKLEYVVGFLLL